MRSEPIRFKKSRISWESAELLLITWSKRNISRQSALAVRFVSRKKALMNGWIVSYEIYIGGFGYGTT